ncbi:MAG: Oxidoreductase domain protein [Verrucomicrobiales bacterium]|nr:Oxidoreductase domain protein [Verrucomicrobiales bacterium]
MKPQITDIHSSLSRRHFLKTTGGTAAGLSLLGTLGLERAVHAASDDTIKIALIGCGGRGTGAASQAMNTGKVKLVAIADMRQGQVDKCLDSLQTQNPGKIDVPKERQFIGFDAYKQAIAAADVVLLASPPGFRPAHYEEAVRQGKHIFMEKPLATDAPGIRQILAANEDAKKKNLKVAVGFQRHHEKGYIETVKHIHDGLIGDVLALRVYWRGGSRAGLVREPGESEIQYQIRNWYYFTWLSGDHIVEQHCHNIDVGNWIKGAYPIRAHGVGGRQVRNARENGQIFDHFSIEYEYADGARMFSVCSQIPRMWGDVSEHVIGSKGKADLGHGYMIKPNDGAAIRMKSDGNGNGWQQEHYPFFDAIRKNVTYNEAEYGAKSTMTAIMGRMAAYSGDLIEWDEALNSKLELVPKQVSENMTPPVVPDKDGFYPVAIPGVTKAL